jgi:hypothetical protein
MKTVRNGRKTPQPFSTSTFEYENESENGKAGHENEREFTENRKRTNSSEIILNTVDIRKINTEYRPVVPSASLSLQLKKLKRESFTRRAK